MNRFVKLMYGRSCSSGFDCELMAQRLVQWHAALVRPSVRPASISSSPNPHSVDISVPAYDAVKGQWQLVVQADNSVKATDVFPV